jgi:peptide/nickel transport system substrate-binding protein
MSKAEMSRKTFIKMMGVVSAGSAFALAGCGSKRASDASGSSSTSGTADTITFAQGSDPRGLDPAYVDDGESAKIMQNIYENLVMYSDESTDVVPKLATDYSISDDGLTYTFSLQQGVKFHDGTDFNAEAVKKCIERQLEGTGRTSDMTYASFTFGTASEGNGVKSIETDGDYTVKITLAAASAPFIKNLAMALAAPIASPAVFEKDPTGLMENPVGTGPYKFVSWDKGQNVKLVANDDYWDKDNAPKTKNIVFRFIAENASRVTALNNGEADIIDGIDDSVVDTIQSAGNSLFTEDGMNINYMAFNCTSSSVCQDQKVRHRSRPGRECRRDGELALRRLCLRRKFRHAGLACSLRRGHQADRVRSGCRKGDACRARRHVAQVHHVLERAPVQHEGRPGARRGHPGLLRQGRRLAGHHGL